MDSQPTLEARSSTLSYVFFGTGEIAVGVLNELEEAELLPSLIVTAPDKPKGRKLVLTPSPVKTWALSRGVKINQPEKLDAEFISKLNAKRYPLFIVSDYGTLLPKTLLDIPRRGVINMHPSLLPRLRGPSPIRSAILNDEKKIGVSIMRVDSKMDHGPIIAQRIVPVPGWFDASANDSRGAPRDGGEAGPPRGRDLDAILARAGGKLLGEVLPHWVGGEIEAHEQNHDVATYSALFKKEDGLIDFVHGDPYKNLLKIRAFDGWPGTYAFFERNGKKVRVKILDAHLEGSALIIDRVQPEGRKEMNFTELEKSGILSTPSSLS